MFLPLFLFCPEGSPPTARMALQAISGTRIRGGRCFLNIAIPAPLRGFYDGKATGSVAQVVGDSLRDSKVLARWHEQTHTSDVSHDELAHFQQRGSLLIRLDPETVWLAKPSGKRGRSATFTDAAIQACLTLKGAVRFSIEASDRACGKPA